MNTLPQEDSVEPRELRTGALYWLGEPDPLQKTAGTEALFTSRSRGEIVLDVEAILFPPSAVPGRPARPELVSPLSVGQRAMHTKEGRAAMIHALAHIEFNAINLALDAVWRFPNMPVEYYDDWLRVAAEEACHFSLLTRHLSTLGFAYGDFSAHNSLWDMAEKTRDDVLARIALVPRTFEARGLDASPPVRRKLAQAGDQAAAEILDIILRDEIGHVAVGNRWYAWLCETRGLDPMETYATLTKQYNAPPLRGPFNIEARKAAGFTDAELASLK